jgi:hypothetical protein
MGVDFIYGKAFASEMTDCVSCLNQIVEGGLAS